jgi:molybdopterin molybdotransferase
MNAPLSVDVALHNILSQLRQTDPEEIALLAALGRVLANDVISQEALPPFDNSSMDGYAVIAQDIVSASSEHPVTLNITQDIPAGAISQVAVKTGEAARIMTGAPLPLGADCIVPVENTNADWSQGRGIVGQTVAIFNAVPVGASIREKGESVQIGQVVLKAGTKLTPSDVGMLASLGVARVSVYKQPRVAIVTSGDEVVTYEQTPALGQIRDANSPAIFALVLQYGGIPVIIPPAKDTLADVRRMFEEALATQPDLIVSTAGVSVGAADYTRTVLEDIGELSFWRINLRPGKPLAFGNIRGIPFFGLPGNPVSAIVTFEVFVRAALLHMGRQPDPRQTVQATLEHPMYSDGRKSYVRVQLTHRDGTWYARETGTQSSGALYSLVLADGLLVLPADVKRADVGTQWKVLIMRPETLERSHNGNA